MVVLILAAAMPAAANASETTTYAYDALGRVVTVAHSGSVNNGLQAQYTYDPADNRTNVTVTGASRQVVIVVPLNGFTVIPVTVSN